MPDKSGSVDFSRSRIIREIIPTSEQLMALHAACVADIMEDQGLSLALQAEVLKDPDAVRRIYNGS